MEEKNAGRVFMLDDDLFFLDLYRNLLEARGYKVFTATNAYKFLLYAKEIHSDVVVLDINMPDVSGWEVLQLLDEETRVRAPVIMTTVEADKGLAVAKGVAHYLPKPLDMENFMEIVETYCAGQKAHDILLLEDYNPFDLSIRDAINELRFSFFSVNDVNAAVLYLNKNIPKAVCVSFDAGRFEEVKPRLKHDRIIYVENRDTIKKLALLLK